MRWIIYMIVCIAAFGCIGSECGNNVLAEMVSPDKKYVATVFVHDCGATTPLVRVVSIHVTGSEFEGNDLDSYVLTMQGDREITVRWGSANQLVIQRPRATRDIYKELKNWKEVQVVIEP